MSNTIELAKSFVPKLDECYRLASLTSVLDGAPELAKQGANANELIIPMMSMDGLADYSRNGGYVQGGVTMTNETVKCNFDRGRRFDVDVMDDLETAGLAFGRLSAQFIRDKVVPELDAFRFASYCGISGVTKKEETLADGAATVAALSAAVTAMDDEEVTATGRYLFITPTLLQGINDMDTTKSKKVLEGFEQVIKVPQRRFYTAIKQLSGKTGEEAGGYTKAAGAANINFAIVQKDALIQYTKHAAPKIIAPENKQDMTPEKILAMDTTIKAELNKVFGSDVSSVFFGGLSALALADDGAFVFEKVLEAVAPLVEEAHKAGIAAAEARLKKHTAVYADFSKGLAPGQQA